MPRTSVDVLLVSPGTTAGWRRADAHATEALRESGVSVAVASSDFRIARHLRRTVPLTDLAEAAAMRRAVTRALRRLEPRAILYSAVQSTLLQPRRRLTGAGLRYDALTADNRPGRTNAVQHVLERRALARLGVLLPGARGSRVPAQPRPGQHVVRLPFPVTMPDAIVAEREPLVVCYAGNPAKKGLDVVVQAWADADAGARRLLITGLAPEDGRRFLRERDVEEPAGLAWAGVLTPQEHAAQVARASAYVSASRYEDYGIAQLEALAAGTPLVSTASDGPYEALAVARELEPAFVAESSTTAALATALRAALEMPPAARTAYSKRARELVAPYSEANVRQRLEQDVIPLLLG